MPVSSGQEEHKKAGTKRQPSQQQGGVSKRNDLFLKARYHNDLPDIPFEPKYLVYPFEPSRFVQYAPTSLERSYKHDYLTEADMGVLIDLIVPETYAPLDGQGSSSRLHPKDEALLEEEMAEQPKSKRAMQHAKKVSWLRKTEYIASEYNRTHTSNDMAESTVGYSVKKKLQDIDTYKDRASQIAAIENSFEQAKQPITKHYSKPGVVAEEVLPVFPDFEMWKYSFAQVIFDTDPATLGKSENEQLKEMSGSVIRGMVDESNEQFVAYFLPTPDTIERREEDKRLGIPFRDDQEYKYMMSKDYNWTVKSKSSKGYEECYFLTIQPNQGVFYNELETRIRLNKRRQKSKSLMNTQLVVHHRALNDDEAATQETRLSQLEPPLVEDEEYDVTVGSPGEEGEGEDRDSEAGSDVESEGKGGGRQATDFETAFGMDDEEDASGEAEDSDQEGEGQGESTGDSEDEDD